MAVPLPHATSAGTQVLRAEILCTGRAQEVKLVVVMVVS
jgi:hypothetical protein